MPLSVFYGIGGMSKFNACENVWNNGCMKLSQKTYRDWVLGTLVYMVVLSMFDDYTAIIHISSASTILFASILLQALTFWTLRFKSWIGSKFDNKDLSWVKPAKFFTLWAVLFFSKFIFLWAIDVTLGSNVEVSGFVGLMVIIVVMTVMKELLVYMDSIITQSVPPSTK